jgi:hypothetical protein
MRTIWLWLTGGWRYFRPGFCCDCRQWTLVFRNPRDGDYGRCEACWLDLK